MENEVLGPENDNIDIDVDVDLLGNRVRLMPTNSLQTQFDTFAVKQGSRQCILLAEKRPWNDYRIRQSVAKIQVWWILFMCCLIICLFFLYFFDANLVPGCTQSLSLVCTLPSHQACAKQSRWSKRAILANEHDGRGGHDGHGVQNVHVGHVGRNIRGDYFWTKLLWSWCQGLVEWQDTNLVPLTGIGPQAGA